MSSSAAESGRGWADQLREWFAVLATAALSGFAGVLVLILWRGTWSKAVETQRLNFLGAALMIVLALIGLGATWLWRIQFKNFEVKAGLVQVSASAEDAPAQG